MRNRVLGTIVILGIIVTTTGFLYQRAVYGAPSVFISTPATSTPIQNFSLTVGTSTPLSQYGSTTLAVYGSSTFQTWINSTHALEIFNAASSTIFRVDTVNSLVSIVGRASSTNLTISGINGSSQCLQINSTGVVSGSGTSCGGGAGFGKTWEFPTGITNAISPTTTVGIIVNASSSITSLSVINGTTTNATSTNLSISGNITLPVGSAAAPSLTFSGSGADNTGIFSESLDRISFSVNGSNMLTLMNVGGYDQVSIASAGTAVRPGLTFRELSNGIFRPDTLANSLAFTTNAVERMRILDTGNIGIGTTSPGALLSVTGQVLADFFTATTTNRNNSLSYLTSSFSTSTNATTTTLYISSFASTSALAISGKNIPGFFYPAFSYATTSAWTGTTTIPLGISTIAETWESVQCTTDAGTVNVQFKNGNNLLNWLNASTTIGTVTFTTNNTFSATTKRSVDVGTPASSPTSISCTVKKSYDL